jgi:Domain of unknown function (DUF4349)
MRKLAFITLLSVLVLGCGQASSPQSMGMFRPSEKALESAPIAKSIAQSEASAPADESFAQSEASALASKKAPAPTRPQAEAVPRKIIYTAGIDLVVGDLSEAVAKLDAVTKQFHGLVAQSEITSNPGAPRSANWRVRVPVDRFTDFVNQVAGLGEAVKDTTNSDDITDKYYDFQVRMENKQVQLERLQKIIKERTDKLSEILEAERELGRVTTELEQLKGSLKLWENQTALSTVNITMRERTRYVAPVAPSFAGNAEETFSSSVHTLVVFGQNLALVAVALTPWLPLIVVAAFLARFVLRRTWPHAAAAIKEK